MGSPACHITLGNQSSSAASFLALAHSRVSNKIRFSGVLKVCVDLTFFEKNRLWNLGQDGRRIRVEFRTGWTKNT